MYIYFYCYLNGGLKHMNKSHTHINKDKKKNENETDSFSNNGSYKRIVLNGGKNHTLIITQKYFLYVDLQ